MIYHPEEAPKKTNVANHKIENGEKNTSSRRPTPKPRNPPYTKEQPPTTTGKRTTNQDRAAQHPITHKLWDKQETKTKPQAKKEQNKEKQVTINSRHQYKRNQRKNQ